jgi:hypothetical protein
MNGLMLDDVMAAQAQYMNPYILEERQLNVTQMDVFSRLMMDRVIFLGTEVNDYTANVLQAQLLYLDANDPRALHIDSVATELKSCLYNEGLTMHYARTPYNNIVVKCRNLEQRYLLDYLRMTFTPPRGKEQEGALSFTRSTLAENYRILYEGLLPYYRAHRPERLAWLEQLIRDALNYRRMQERREREYNQVSRLL